MEMVDGMHAGQIRACCSHVGRCRSTSTVRGDTQMTPDHTAFQVRSSWYGGAKIGGSSWEGHNTGCSEKTPVSCPCNRLAALRGAPQMPKFT